MATMIEDPRFLATLQQLHTLRTGIERIIREDREAAPATVAKLSALVVTAVDDAAPTTYAHTLTERPEEAE